MEKPAESIIKQEIEVIIPADKVKISLWLDDYDNLFSDFDPRSFAQRELSDDFLNEVKKFLLEAEEGRLMIILLMPLAKRNAALEKIIRTRLHTYFLKHFHRLQKNKQTLKSKGYRLTAVGMLLMVLASTVSYIGESFIYHLMVVVLEPAGWFAAWYGLDHIFYLSKEERKELKFYQKIAQAEIKFDAY